MFRPASGDPEVYRASYFITANKHSLKVGINLQYNNETNILPKWNHIYCKIKKRVDVSKNNLIGAL